MKSGYFRLEGARPRPYVDLDIQFPAADDGFLHIPFLIDTGADRTLLSPTDGVRAREELGVDLLSLPHGEPIGGVGGEIETRNIEATIAIGSYIRRGTVSLAEPPPGLFLRMPSLLGWDIIRDLALFIEYSTDRVIFLEPEETGRANLIGH